MYLNSFFKITSLLIGLAVSGQSDKETESWKVYKSTGMALQFRAAPGWVVGAFEAPLDEKFNTNEWAASMELPCSRDSKDGCGKIMFASAVAKKNRVDEAKSVGFTEHFKRQYTSTSGFPKFVEAETVKGANGIEWSCITAVQSDNDRWATSSGVRCSNYYQKKSGDFRFTNVNFLEYDKTVVLERRKAKNEGHYKSSDWKTRPSYVIDPKNYTLKETFKKVLEQVTLDP